MAQRVPRDRSADVFAGLISGTPFIGGDYEYSLSPQLSLPAEVVFERESGSNSFEARAGVRSVFAHASRRSTDSFGIYGKLDAGAITCASSNSLCGLGEVAVGALADKGTLDGSYFEIGYGQTDLGFRKEPAAAVLDLYLTHPFGRISPFVGISGGHRSFDAYLGIAVALR